MNRKVKVEIIVSGYKPREFDQSLGIPVADFSKRVFVDYVISEEGIKSIIDENILASAVCNSIWSDIRSSDDKIKSIIAKVVSDTLECDNV